jgi:Leucine Rich repeat
MVYSNTDIGVEGVTAMALKSNVALQELHLGFNNIEVMGATALAEALKSNSTLQELKSK